MGLNITIAVIDGAAMLFLLSLLLMHGMLVSNNTTTKECCKSYWDISSGNPFKKSNFIKNCLNMWCSKTTYNSSVNLPQQIFNVNQPISKYYEDISEINLKYGYPASLNSFQMRNQANFSPANVTQANMIYSQQMRLPEAKFVSGFVPLGMTQIHGAPQKSIITYHASNNF